MISTPAAAFKPPPLVYESPCNAPGIAEIKAQGLKGVESNPDTLGHREAVVRFLKTYWGILLIPGLAFAYGAYALWELTTGPFQNATIIYTYVIAIPMLILGAITLAGDLRRPEDATTSEEKEAGGGDESAAGGARRVWLVVLASLALVLTLPYVGYPVGFFLYVLALLWAVELKNWLAAVIIAVIMTLIVHFVFVALLGQDLPVGPFTFLES